MTRDEADEIDKLDRLENLNAEKIYVSPRNIKKLWPWRVMKKYL